jgi:UDP-N-acetylmuramyl pentapeptide phosphotransferase/UDP-N-acetylglucosamine-1-phosphate transferase
LPSASRRQEATALHEVALSAGLFILTTTLSWMLVGQVRRFADLFGLVDVPNERSSHSRPIPLGGGLAIVVINLIVWVVAAFTNGFGIPLDRVLPIVAAGLIIAGISLIDDLGHVPYPVRLGVQTVAALVFVLGVFPFTEIELPKVGVIGLGVFGGAITVIWLVGMTNSFNFMDGIDGMAGGLAVSAGAGWVFVGAVAGKPTLGLLGGILGASALGFLFHNWHPARIFMGDVGATFLGYAFAALTVVAAKENPALALAGALLVWPCYFDSGFTVIRRLLHRQNVFVGHRTFLFHRLVLAGWSHSQAATFYVLLPIAGSAIAVTWAKSNRFMHEIAVLAALLMAVGLWRFVERVEERRAEPSTSTEVLSALLESTMSPEPKLGKPERDLAS